MYILGCFPYLKIVFSLIMVPLEPKKQVGTMYQMHLNVLDKGALLVVNKRILKFRKRR